MNGESEVNGDSEVNGGSEVEKKVMVAVRMTHGGSKIDSRWR